MHSYHQGKKPHDAIRQYIRHFSRPGELVLDPFCGSGGTALAAMLEGRTAIALDRSPAAVFIARNYCTAIDPDEVQRAAEELMAAARPELDWLYETRCDRCGGPARTAYTVYSEQFCCPHCRQMVPLADCPQRFRSGRRKRPPVRIALRGAMSKPFAPAARGMGGCRCWPSIAAWADASRRRISGVTTTRMRRSGTISPALIWARSRRSPAARFRIGGRPPPFRRRSPAGKPTFARRASSSVADLYTKRNLWALAALRAGAAASSCPQAALFALTAVSLAVSRMQRYSPDSGFPNMLLVGTYYIPPVGREIEVGSWYEGKLRALVKGYAAIRRAMPANAEGLVAMADARQLDLPGDSIDYIFTDPPYADAVQYGELNFVWESWLGGTPDWHGDEIVVNRSRGKDADDWARAMRAAMGECHRVLKPGRWLSLCYHDTLGPPLGDAPGPDARRRFRDRFGRGGGEHRDGPEVVQPVDVEQGDQARPGDQFSQAAAGPDREPSPARPWNSKRPPGRFSASIWPNMAARRRIDCTTPWSATWSAWARCNLSISRPCCGAWRRKIAAASRSRRVDGANMEAETRGRSQLPA